jgi:hypothetical protein
LILTRIDKGNAKFNILAAVIEVPDEDALVPIPNTGPTFVGRLPSEEELSVNDEAFAKVSLLVKVLRVTV